MECLIIFTFCQLKSKENVFFGRLHNLWMAHSTKNKSENEKGATLPVEMGTIFISTYCRCHLLVLVVWLDGCMRVTGNNELQFGSYETVEMITLCEGR